MVIRGVVCSFDHLMRFIHLVHARDINRRITLPEHRLSQILQQKIGGQDGVRTRDTLLDRQIPHHSVSYPNCPTHLSDPRVVRITLYEAEG